MRKILYMLLPLAAMAFVLTACHMAPKQELGDTVAAKVFAPIDTAAMHRKQAKAMKNVKDSTDIFFVGPASDKKHFQLISYPSRRDTMTLGTTRHLRVAGSADPGHVVRVAYWTGGKDTLISRIEEFTPANAKQGK